DAYGNITVFPDADSGEEYEYDAENMMKAEVYTDGVDPKILDGTMALTTKFNLGKGKPDIYGQNEQVKVGDGKLNYIDQQTFIITFSEAIINKTDFNQIKDDASKEPMPITDYY